MRYTIPGRRADTSRRDVEVSRLARTFAALVSAVIAAVVNR